MKNSIEIKNLSKKYENFQLDNVSLQIPAGSIVGLIGENGAGKTTIIKSILSIITPDSGSIKLFGKDTNINDAKEDIGIVLDGAFLAEILKVKDVNSILKNIYKKWDEKLFFDYLSKFNIPINQEIKTLSKGMRKKLEIASALSHHPKLLILDEPTSGLDPIVRSDILDIFLEFIQDENNSILLSTHITSDLDHIADYIILIDNGKIMFSETKDDLIENYGILKCDEKTFKTLDSKDILRHKKNRYNYEVLVVNKREVKKKYKDVIVDKVTIEDIMLMYIKGEK